MLKDLSGFKDHEPCCFGAEEVRALRTQPRNGDSETTPGDPQSPKNNTGDKDIATNFSFLTFCLGSI